MLINSVKRIKPYTSTEVTNARSRLEQLRPRSPTRAGLSSKSQGTNRQVARMGMGGVEALSPKPEPLKPNRNPEPCWRIVRRLMEKPTVPLPKYRKQNPPPSPAAHRARWGIALGRTLPALATLRPAQRRYVSITS